MPYNMGPWTQPDSGTNNPPLLSEVANQASPIFKGSLLGRTANVLVALGTTPAANTILGVAASDNLTAPGFGMSNQPATVQWGANLVPYHPATTDTLFASHIVSGSDVNLLPLTTDVGASYGLRVKANGEVAADRSLTGGSARVAISRIVTGPAIDAIVVWRFLPTAIAPA